MPRNARRFSETRRSSTTSADKKVNAQTIALSSFEISADTHFVSSVAMIKEAVAFANAGRAAVLGCGRCTEIPIRLLNEKFEIVDLIDIDRNALNFVKAECKKGNNEKHVYKFHCADLTGMIAKVGRRANEIVESSNDPLECLKQLGLLLENTPPGFWKPSGRRRYDFLICSGVLTQLQAVVREHVEKVFVGKFPDCADALSADKSWRESAWSFARGLEDRFIEHLSKLTKSGGIIYLAETVHVSWLTQLDHQTVSTNGRWIALRTARLADYLRPRDAIISEQSWYWLREGREGDYWGRLYGVQAVIYQNG